MSRHTRLVNHVNNERALQDTDFCGDLECVCWCDGTSMDVHEQASQNGLQVKCLCGAVWSSPVTFRPKMLEPQKTISTMVVEVVILMLCVDVFLETMVFYLGPECRYMSTLTT